MCIRDRFDAAHAFHDNVDGGIGDDLVDRGSEERAGCHVQVRFMLKIPHENAADGEFDALSVRDLRAVFVDDAVDAAANRAKAQQGYVKVFHNSSYMRLCRLKNPAC
jgi:hypothetical protein